MSSQSALAVKVVVVEVVVAALVVGVSSMAFNSSNALDISAAVSPKASICLPTLLNSSTICSLMVTNKNRVQSIDYWHFHKSGDKNESGSVRRAFAIPGGG